MGKKNPLVDAYIEKSADFAKPILRHLRALVHEACPECVEEMKWSFPHFSYKGMMAGMASFKEHCTFGFWKGALIIDDNARSETAMGQLGRIAKLSDLPPKATLIKWTKRAKALNDENVRLQRVPKAPRPQLRMPADFSAALNKNKKAHSVFAAFSPSKRRDYIEWISEAKTDDTRTRRLTTALEWIASGKSRNWKYERP